MRPVGVQRRDIGPFVIGMQAALECLGRPDLGYCRRGLSLRFSLRRIADRQLARPSPIPITVRRPGFRAAGLTIMLFSFAIGSVPVPGIDRISSPKPSAGLHRMVMRWQGNLDRTSYSGGQPRVFVAVNCTVQE
ncbi:hypothetical protein [Paracoccus mutanolyticus]|nr:hypothetical protein [Paracoccus mutanolyticus]